MKEQESLESIFGELDKIVGKLEEEDISLEESFNLYDKGIKLLNVCNDRIGKIEKKIMTLNEEGQMNEL